MPRQKSVLSREQRAEILRLRNDDMAMAAIAVQLNIPKFLVSRALEEMGIPARRCVTKQTLPREQRKQIVEVWNKTKLTTVQIAEQFGVGRSVVGWIVTRYGERRRAPRSVPRAPKLPRVFESDEIKAKTSRDELLKIVKRVENWSEDDFRKYHCENDRRRQGAPQFTQEQEDKIYDLWVNQELDSKQIAQIMGIDNFKHVYRITRHMNR